MVVKIKQKDGKQHTQLTGPQRRFVVMTLARWNSPSETARMLEAEHGVTMTRQAIAKYDPTCVTGASLSPDLKKLFHRTREKFVEEIEQLPLSHRAVRLDRLEREYQAAIEAKNSKLAVKVISEAGKEMKPLDYQPDEDESGEDETDD